MSDPTSTITPAPPATPTAAPMLPATLPQQDCSLTFNTRHGLEALQRAGKLFCSSPLVPKEYQGQDGLSSCCIALDLANRIGANPLMVMQNLYIVHGRPGWSSKFLIATFNQCGRFTPIRYEFSGTEGQDDWGCRAWTTEKATNEKLLGPKVTIRLAKAEGWESKSGSKWKTMPEQMLRYRSAAWFINTVAPELSMGLPTSDEVEDIIEGELVPAGAPAAAPVAALGTAAAPAQPAAANPVPATASGRLARLKPKDVTPPAEEIPTERLPNPDDKAPKGTPLVDPNDPEAELPWPTE